VSTPLVIIRGATGYYPVEVLNQGGDTTAVFAPTDTFTCTIGRGQDQAPLFNPSVTFYTANGTQTGYDQGELLITIASVQSAALEPGGTYAGQIWWDQQAVVVLEFALYCKPAAGVADQDITPYNSYQDMLLYADWVKMIQRKDTDQEGFYSQRLQARQWYDQIILNAYIGTGWIPFGSPGVSMYSWSGGWSYGFTLTSQWLRDQLAADRLLLRPEVVRACAYKAISIVAMSPIGGNNFQAAGQWFAREADREVLKTTAEIDTSTPPSGLGGLPVPLGNARVIVA
jgi:hypothetical protein